MLPVNPIVYEGIVRTRGSRPGCTLKLVYPPAVSFADIRLHAKDAVASSSLAVPEHEDAFDSLVKVTALPRVRCIWLDPTTYRVGR